MQLAVVAPIVAEFRDTLMHSASAIEPELFEAVPDSGGIFPSQLIREVNQLSQDICSSLVSRERQPELSSHCRNLWASLDHLTHSWIIWHAQARNRWFHHVVAYPSWVRALLLERGEFSETQCPIISSSSSSPRPTTHSSDGDDDDIGALAKISTECLDRMLHAIDDTFQTGSWPGHFQMLKDAATSWKPLLESMVGNMTFARSTLSILVAEINTLREVPTSGSTGSGSTGSKTFAYIQQLLKREKSFFPIKNRNGELSTRRRHWNISTDPSHTSKRGWNDIATEWASKIRNWIDYQPASPLYLRRHHSTCPRLYFVVATNKERKETKETSSGVLSSPKLTTTTRLQLTAPGSFLSKMAPS